MNINTITYNSAISALAKAARSESKHQRRFDYNQTKSTERATIHDIDTLWRQALDLVKTMKILGVKRDVFTYSSNV